MVVKSTVFISTFVCLSWILQLFLRLILNVACISFSKSLSGNQILILFIYCLIVHLLSKIGPLTRLGLQRDLVWLLLLSILLVYQIFLILDIQLLQLLEISLVILPDIRCTLFVVGDPPVGTVLPPWSARHLLGFVAVNWATFGPGTDDVVVGPILWAGACVFFGRHIRKPVLVTLLVPVGLIGLQIALLKGTVRGLQAVLVLHFVRRIRGPQTVSGVVGLLRTRRRQSRFAGGRGSPPRLHLFLRRLESFSRFQLSFEVWLHLGLLLGLHRSQLSFRFERIRSVSLQRMLVVSVFWVQIVFGSRRLVVAVFGYVLGLDSGGHRGVWRERVFELRFALDTRNDHWVVDGFVLLALVEEDQLRV